MFQSLGQIFQIVVLGVSRVTAEEAAVWSCRFKENQQIRHKHTSQSRSLDAVSSNAKDKIALFLCL